MPLLKNRAMQVSKKSASVFSYMRQSRLLTYVLDSWDVLSEDGLLFESFLDHLIKRCQDNMDPPFRSHTLGHVLGHMAAYALTEVEGAYANDAPAKAYNRLHVAFKGTKYDDAFTATITKVKFAPPPPASSRLGMSSSGHKWTWRVSSKTLPVHKPLRGRWSITHWLHLSHGICLFFSSSPCSSLLPVVQCL